jgi:multiple sugar transport system permease protein
MTTSTISGRIPAVRRRTSARRTTQAVTRVSNTVLGVLFVGAMLFPVYWMVNSSFAPTGTTLNRDPIPLHPTLDGYVKAIEQQGHALFISLIIAVSAVVLCLAISAPAAFAVAHFKLRGVRIFLGVILVTQMIPGIVVANALYSLYNTFGLLNSLPGLILANATSGIPFAVLVMSAYMQALPKELVEAARVDGAGYFRAFISIVLPVSKNALVTAAIFTFLHGWGDFLFALTLTTTDRIRPVTLSLYNYISSDYIQWNAVMATATLASIPALAFLIFAQKYIAAGTSSGALK